MCDSSQQTNVKMANVVLVMINREIKRRLSVVEGAKDRKFC